MSYWEFHLVFILPVIGLLGAWAWRTRAVTRRELWWIAGMSCIALVYTTPWDNYLVAQGVWIYSPDRVQATIGWVPVEEYAFFLLQPLLTGLWLFLVLRLRTSVPSRPTATATRGVVAGLVAGVATLGFLGAALLFTDSGYYLGLILVWTAPVLALQIGVGWSVLREYRHSLGWAAAMPTLYLWGCDRLAIGLGIWHISDRYTTGWALGGLPVEEALFFLVTNLMVVQGLLLIRHASGTTVARRAPSVALR